MNCRKHLAAVPGQVPCAEQGRFGSFTVISQTYQDIGSEPTLAMEKARAEGIAGPFDPWVGLADQTGTNFARPRLGKGWNGKPKGPEKRGPAGN